MGLIAIPPSPLRAAADLKGEGESRVGAEGRCGRVRTGRKETIGRIHGPLKLRGIDSRATPHEPRLAVNDLSTTSGTPYYRSIAILGPTRSRRYGKSFMLCSRSTLPVTISAL